jgi:hypothetical protein
MFKVFPHAAGKRGVREFAPSISASSPDRLRVCHFPVGAERAGLLYSHSMNEPSDWRALYPFRSRAAVIDGHHYHYVDEGYGSRCSWCTAIRPGRFSGGT